MMKAEYLFSIIGTDAPAEQERGLAVVSIEHRPVEMLAAAAFLRCLVIEEEEIGNAFVWSAQNRQRWRCRKP